MNTEGMDRRAFVRTAGGVLVTATVGCAGDRVTGVPLALASGPLSASVMTPLVPNILNDASFETGWDGFTSFSGGAPLGVTRPLLNGVREAEFLWTASRMDRGAQFARPFVPQVRIWVRFEFQLTSAVSTIWKFCRTREAGFNTLLGGLFVRRGAQTITWGFDTELSAQDVNIGISQDRVVDGAWHSIEFDYWRNGDPSGFPSVAVWLDGVPTVGSLPLPAPARWVNGRLNAGERKSSKKVGVMALMGTLNGGNTTNGRCHIDHVSISSVGRIGV